MFKLILQAYIDALYMFGLRGIAATIAFALIGLSGYITSILAGFFGAGTAAALAVVFIGFPLSVFAILIALIAIIERPGGVLGNGDEPNV